MPLPSKVEELKCLSTGLKPGVNEMTRIQLRLSFLGN